MLSSATSSNIFDKFRHILNTDQVVRSVDHVGLALILADEMLKPSSAWKEYLSILPSSYTTPLFFSQEQLQVDLVSKWSSCIFKQMKPSPAFEESVLMFRTVARHFIYFFMRLVTEKNLSVFFHRLQLSFAEEQEKTPTKCPIWEDFHTLAELYFRSLPMVRLDRVNKDQHDP